MRSMHENRRMSEESFRRLELEVIQERDRVIAANGMSPVMPTALIPWFRRSLARVEDDSIKKLSTHIAGRVAEAAQTETVADSKEPMALDRAREVVDRACQTCGGNCCRHGAEHAYLDAASVRRVWDSKPELTELELVDSYLRCVPQTAHEHSCIFHTDRGCSLPREMRSNTCLEFYCPGLRSIVADVNSSDEPHVFLAFCSGNEIKELHTWDV